MNIRDIAKIAGVSASTVSKVMNGKDRDISEETKKKVLDVIEQEHYIPYFKFLEKEGMKSRLIGMILRKDNRTKQEMQLVAEKAARENGYSLVVGYADGMEDTKQLVKEMKTKKISGFLIDESHWVADGNMEDTTVYLSDTRTFDERQKTTFYYRPSEAARIAVSQLYKEGHQKIACIVTQQDKSILDGYKIAMQNNNLHYNPLWIYIFDSVNDIEKIGIPQVMKERVTAIVCGSPEVACYVERVLSKNNTVVPDEISLISIGDENELEYVGNGITAVQFPIEKMVSAAVECLLEIINQEKRIEVVRKFEPQVKWRNSVVRPPADRQGEKIVVVGSMNIDVTIYVNEIPGAGENQMANKVYIFPGGKGGNQAVGVGKLGGQVYMIGCLGNDMEGKQIYTSLTENHVHVDGVRFNTVLPTGKAYIHVDQSGESAITVYTGANSGLSMKQIDRYEYLFEKAKYCLVSTEIPEMIVEHTVRLCRENGTQVILKPTVAEVLNEKIYQEITYLVPNEKELHILVPGNATIEDKAYILREKGVKNVIVTLGARGCYLKNDDYSMYFDGTGFEAVDTTGGADSFISALAVYLSEGRNLLEAVEFAIYASGISVTRHGVQQALPDRRAVDIYEDEIHSQYYTRRKVKAD